MQSDTNILYKLTFMDDNLPAICSGVYTFYTNDLTDFERHWLPLVGEGYPERVESYYRSKFGTIASDWYSDRKDLNIVQSAKAKIIDYKINKYKNKRIELSNGWNCISTFEFDELIIEQHLVRYGKTYMVIARYEATGCKRCDPTYNHWYDKIVKYHQMHFFGNKVATYEYRKPEVWSIDAYKEYYTDDKEFFKDDKVNCFVWLPIKRVTKDYKLKALTKKEIDQLMQDITGESG